VLPADRIEEFLRVASVSGFRVIAAEQGRWPKTIHSGMDTKVDILPEGERPGSKTNPAPTSIPHPSTMGADESTLKYIELPALIELKIAAGRGRDEADVIELMRLNIDQSTKIRQHLTAAHPNYVVKFDQLLERTKTEESD